MKKIGFFSFASALMLASTVGFSSCSSDSDVAETGGGVAGQTVKTQFAINIPRAGSNNGSRATGAQTQGDGTTFLGMKNIWLLSFEETPNDNSTSTGALQLEGISSSENISAEKSSKIYQNVAVNVGTSNFIFYGFGDVNNDAIGAFNTRLDFGSNTRIKLNNINFQLKPVVQTVSYQTGEAKNIVDVLNAIDKSWQDRDENLKTIHAKFKNLKAGSATSVCAMIQNIFDYIKKNYGENYPDAVTTFKNTVNNCENFKINDNDIVTTDVTFPRNLSLPDGAVSLQYDDANGFSYKQTTDVGAMSINPTSITYPALLSYYESTPIYTHETRVQNWPQSTAEWKADNFTGWTTNNAKVTSNTAAIALANNINYGVASLKLQVKCKNETLTQNGDGAAITIPADGLKVTGILIGNQPDNADYKFNPKADDKFSKTIWDSQVNLWAKYNIPSDANYTIVLPNNVAGENQKDVMFALELENNTGEAFNGYDGIIQNGSKFYLVGTLTTRNTDGAGITTPSEVPNPSVFMSDYQTELTASISSLKNAYNCIPDIRTTNMQLGLSVDLTWKQGIKYDIEIGGKN